MMSITELTNSIYDSVRVRTGFRHPKLKGSLTPSQMRRDHGLDSYLSKFEIDLFSTQLYNYGITYNSLNPTKETDPAAGIEIHTKMPKQDMAEAVLTGKTEFGKHVGIIKKFLGQYQSLVGETADIESIGQGYRQVTTLKRKFTLAELAALIDAFDGFTRRINSIEYFNNVPRNARRMVKNVGINLEKS